MSCTVCLCPSNTLIYPNGGGHFWVFLNWALGLRQIGCRIIWMEVVGARMPPDEIKALTAILKLRLAAFDLADTLALCPPVGSVLPPEVTDGCMDLDSAAAHADLFLNFRYGTPQSIVKRFRRSALVDIDPGLLQMWVSNAYFEIAQHDLYFTIGETVGQPGALFPDLGLNWIYTGPCVALDCWTVAQAPDNAPFTTIAHWWAAAGLDTEDVEDKRAGFESFLDLPRLTKQPLELALDVNDGDAEQERLRQHGWRVRHSYSVASTPLDYQRYIQSSRGEFSCVKGSCVRLQNAWISDRSLCYLASGKPVVVQHTGPSRILPDAEGMFRFRTLSEAAAALETINSDYQHHSKAARALAEAHFDARKTATAVLERALL